MELSLFERVISTTAASFGISPIQAGELAFAMAAGIGALSGTLIAPLTTVYYDSGFLIGLKGFVGSIVGGLASYPVAAAGAVFVGLVEAWGSFMASEYKEVRVSCRMAAAKISATVDTSPISARLYHCSNFDDPMVKPKLDCA